MFFQLGFLGCFMRLVWEMCIGETGFTTYLSGDWLRILWICMLFFGVGKLTLEICMQNGPAIRDTGIGFRSALIGIAALCGCVLVFLLRQAWSIREGHYVLFLVPTVFGMIGERERTVLRVWFWTRLVFTLETYAASMIGIVRYLVLSDDSPLGAHGFGFVHTTNFGASVFYLVLAGWCAYRETDALWHLLGALFGSFLCLRYAGAETSGYLLIAAVVIRFVVMIAEKFPKVRGFLLRVFDRFLCGAYFYATAVMLLLIKMYDFEETSGNVERRLAHRIDSLLHSRLIYFWQLTQENPVTAFGSIVELHGAVYGTTAEYNFVDSSYLNILLTQGWGVWLILGIGCFILFRAYAKRGDLIGDFVLLLICIHSMEEHHFAEFQFNPWAFLAVCVLGKRLLTEKRERKEPVLLPHMELGRNVGLALSIFTTVAFLVKLAWIVMDLAEMCVGMDDVIVTKRVWMLLMAAVLGLMWGTCYEVGRRMAALARKIDDRREGAA